MPYLRTEQVKQMRAELKKAVPEVKLSVTKDNNVIVVCLMKGDKRILEEQTPDRRGHEQLNHYYLDYYKDRVYTYPILEKICKILLRDQIIESTDGDYGNIPNYYVNLHIGKWDKNYEAI